MGSGHMSDGKCSSQVGKQMFSRMLVICPYLGLLIGELQEQKLLRYFQEPRRYSPYSVVGGSRDILDSKRAGYKRGGGVP